MERKCHATETLSPHIYTSVLEINLFCSFYLITHYYKYRILRIQAADSIKNEHFHVRTLFEGGFYSRAASINYGGLHTLIHA